MDWQENEEKRNKEVTTNIMRAADTIKAESPTNTRVLRQLNE